MTTFTITCPPTVAATTLSNSFSGEGQWAADFFGDSVYRNQGEAANEGYASSFTDAQGNVFISSSASSSQLLQMTLVDEFDNTEGNGFTSYEETFSWNGARTINLTDNDTITGSTWTAEATTSSQTTTTQSATIYQTTFTQTINTTTVTGKLVEIGEEQSIPSTTVTQTAGLTTQAGELSTTRLVTTTQEDTFNRWRASEGGATHRGLFHEATAVYLETSNLGNLLPELGWVITTRPEYTNTLPAVASFPETSNFTVFPFFVTAGGAVIDETDIVSSEELQTQTTYKTTLQSQTELTVGAEGPLNASPAQLPPLTRTLQASTRNTEEYFSTIAEFAYTGGETSITTIQTTKTHEGRIGAVTWNATHSVSTTAQTSFEVLTSKTDSAEFGAIYNDRFLEEFENATQEGLALEGVEFSEIATQGGEFYSTADANFQRKVTQGAGQYLFAATQNQAGSSLSFAFAAPSALNVPARLVGAQGITVQDPLYVAAARTALTPLGSWSYIDSGASVAVSADGAGLSATTTSGPTSSLVTQSTSGAWTVEGAAISRADLGDGMALNMGGVPATGDSLTAFYAGGIFSTTNSAGSGTTEASEALTSLVGADNRTAYLPASNVFIAGDQRYGTSKRNITAIVDETAIITNRSQLVL